MASNQRNPEIGAETPKASRKAKNLDRRKVIPRLGRAATLEELVQEYNRTHDWWMFRSRAWAHLPFPSPVYDQLSRVNPFSKCPMWEACARNYTELLVVLIDAGLDVPTLQMRDYAAVLRRAAAWGFEFAASDLFCWEVARGGYVPGIAREKTGEYVSQVRNLQEDYNGYLMGIKISTKSGSSAPKSPFHIYSQRKLFMEI